MAAKGRIKDELKKLYDPSIAVKTEKKISDLIDLYKKRISLESDKIIRLGQINQSDVVLITYADHVINRNYSPLQALNQFLLDYLKDIIGIVHILPFFPYSSDDGFSIIDYFKVNPKLGDWDDIKKIGRNFNLMFDAVINHISRDSNWFQAFLKGESPYRDFFIKVEPSLDISEVVRPRTLPLLTPVKTVQGEEYVWTTFSSDQIDLDFSNPEVLLEIINLLLFYVEKGASIIRLDAIAYLWKKFGTSCIHLPETHSIIRIFRAVLDEVAPEVYLISETNVPHKENISYFGRIIPGTERTDEAQMVYQFPLAPLILHTFFSGDASILCKWCRELKADGIFFNFIASHDGIGIMPAKGLLDQKEINTLIEKTISHNGVISYKKNSDGSKSVYELNITLYDALNDPNNINESQEDLEISRYLASQAIMLSLAGVPGIYLSSLFGFRNCYSCVNESNRPRSINRQKYYVNKINEYLSDPKSRESKVFKGYHLLLKLRRKNKAFHPKGRQEVLSTPTSIFALFRISPDNEQSIISIVNVTENIIDLELNLSKEMVNLFPYPRDLLSSGKLKIKKETLSVKLLPYQVIWVSSD